MLCKYLGKKHMENWISNNRKTCTSKDLVVDEEENGDSEEHRDVDYDNDDNRAWSSFGDIHVATAMLTTTTITGIQSRWW